MKNTRRMLIQLTTLTGVGFGAWYAGKYSEKKESTSIINNDSSNTFALNVKNIRSRPALPIFGTVSAATPITVPDDPADMGNKLSVQGSRINQVCFLKNIRILCL